MSSGAQAGDLVVDVNSIKDESHRGLNSPQHGSRSINGTPTSTHSSLLADGSTTGTGPIEFISTDGLKPAMYTTQIFASMSNSGSGTPSPIPYTDHVTQYTQSSMGTGTAGSAIYSSSTGRPSSSGAFSVSDPYYREYFTTVTSGAGTPEPVYSTQLRQGAQLGYGDETASGGATASFVERYVRQSAYHGKAGVIAAATAAGLTVDLPSPDSGIGADAITPRDQNTLQQVSPRPNYPKYKTPTPDDSSINYSNLPLLCEGIKKKKNSHHHISLIFNLCVSLHVFSFAVVRLHGTVSDERHTFGSVVVVSERQQQLRIARISAHQQKPTVARFRTSERRRQNPNPKNVSTHTHTHKKKFLPHINLWLHYINFHVRSKSELCFIILAGRESWKYVENVEALCENGTS